jgi:pyruvate formate lyase activating enzyme
MAEMVGRIHSCETFGTLDGPGIRFVLFMQGCPLRCQFCHNPDSWDIRAGKLMTLDEVLAEIEPYVSFYRPHGGGLTVSGGEPLVQAPFVTRLFREAKKRWGITTALDTSGMCEPGQADELLDETDLVLLDLKAMGPELHKELTGQPQDRILRFARHLSDRGKKMWIRRVLIPGVNDSAKELLALGRFIGSLNGVEKIEVLPYHKMGVHKWHLLGITYPLEGVESPGEKEVARAHRLIAQGVAEAVHAI